MVINLNSMASKVISTITPFIDVKLLIRKEKVLNADKTDYEFITETIFTKCIIHPITVRQLQYLKELFVNINNSDWMHFYFDNVDVEMANSMRQNGSTEITILNGKRKGNVYQVQNVNDLLNSGWMNVYASLINYNNI
jgi:hypothetical protein